MPTRRRPSPSRRTARRIGLAKAPTGIPGFDAITGGGLPRGRPTLVCGGPGCGKSLFGLEFLVRGAERGEAGLLVSFEEPERDLIANARSLGYDLARLIRRKRLAIEYVRVERAEILETGEYDLEALFIRLDHAIRSIGASRIVLDTVESLFAGLTNAGVLRAELRRLLAWLKARGMTAIITGERGERTLTRHGLEEYVSDCVIVLDHRVSDQISTRRLRVLKYRGSSHGTNEYPFLIDHRGIAVVPITSLGLTHAATSERVSTGLAWLDGMFGGGYFRGSSVLVSGAAGTSKTIVAASFLDAACRRGERALCFQFEESPAQYARNVRSVGLDLERWRTRGLLRVHSARPTLQGLESHLASMYRDVEAAVPTVVVVDPLSSFAGGTTDEVNGMLVRLIDFLKQRSVTAVYTHLIHGSGAERHVEAGVSSLMDAWILLRAGQPGAGAGAGRSLTIVKSRGMAHEMTPRPFRLTDHGAVAEPGAGHRLRRIRP
jgi:circadian clock protein KaiC